MDNARFLKLVIIVLLLINTGTLAFMWFNKLPGGPTGNERGPYNFLVRELNLTPQQQDKYQTLRNGHHEAMEEFNRRNRKLHDRYFGLLHAPSADSVLVERLADSIAINQKEAELVTLHHFQQVRAICTPVQQKKFDEVIDEALQMMAPKPPAK